ncbi:ParA family protein, partial [Streptomyces niveus]
MPALGHRSPSSGLEAVGSVAVRTFTTHQHMTTAHQTMDGQHVNAMAGNESGRESTHFADFDEVPEGHFYDP